MDDIFLVVALALGIYSAVMSTMNRISINNGGKITNDSVISPEGKKILKKAQR